MYVVSYLSATEPGLPVALPFVITLRNKAQMNGGTGWGTQAERGGWDLRLQTVRGTTFPVLCTGRGATPPIHTAHIYADKDSVKVRKAQI